MLFFCLTLGMFYVIMLLTKIRIEAQFPSVAWVYAVRNGSAQCERGRCRRNTRRKYILGKQRTSV